MEDSLERPILHEQRVETLVAEFEREFKRPPEGIAEAPGRVNLIGEHVDYNDGLVLPFAVDRSVLVAWARTRDRSLCDVRSLDYDDFCLLEPTAFDVLGKETLYDGWAGYPQAVLFALHDEGERTRGLELAISGDVPQGSGLSSSAALEVAVAGAFRSAFDLELEDVELAQLCQRAENDYVGVQCGIMDQFAAALSARDHALLIDCRSLAHEAVPLRLDAAGLTIVIANSAVGRELAGSAYNDRRRECEEAIRDLRVRLVRPELASLRDVSEADLARIAIDSVPMRRARHVVTEIARVAAAVEALSRNDFAAFGSLMVESHISLRDDYEVSSKELDLLVGLATAQEYVLGARLTGAGFGGCTVNLVRTEAVDAFSRDVIAPYRERTGLPAVMYVTSPQDGLRTWRL
jgi:galactokinase